MAVSKVQLSNGETLIDISLDTVEPSALLEGYIAHDKTGNQIVGTMNFSTNSVKKMPNIYAIYQSSTIMTFDIRSFPKYKDITQDQIVIELIQFGGAVPGILAGIFDAQLSFEYTPESGIITMTSSDGIFSPSRDIVANIYIFGQNYITAESIMTQSIFESSNEILVSSSGLITNKLSVSKDYLISSNNSFSETYQLPTASFEEITTNQTLNTAGKFLTNDIIVNIPQQGSGVNITKLKNIDATYSSQKIITISIKSLYSNYANITKDDIIVEFAQIGAYSTNLSQVQAITKTYNSSTGVITLTASHNVFRSNKQNIVNIYIIK